MKSFQIISILICLICGSFLAAQIQERSQKRPLIRAKRPVFDKKKWNGIFFEDLFSEGLSGNRPEKSEMTAAKDRPMNSKEGTEAIEKQSGWVGVIDSSTLENEIKRWQQQLTEQVTTPIKFKTTHQEISEQFSMLAMWFTVIGQYEGEVRWNEAADSARYAFMDSATRSRATDISAFNSVKQRTEDLTELVRGGKFPAEPNASSEVEDWSVIVDRNPIMSRLELSVSEELKQATASEKDFKSQLDIVTHEAGVIAAMSRVLQLPEMLDADDDDYNAISEEMLVAALEMKAAAEAKNLEGVNSALNRINQACTNCHGDYR